MKLFNWFLFIQKLGEIFFCNPELTSETRACLFMQIAGMKTES